MSARIEFPQPIAPESCKDGDRVWVVGGSNSTWETYYGLGYAKVGNAYTTQEEADQRAAWNAQEKARLVIPAWFRKLGADVEFQWAPGKWETVDLSGRDWSQEKPENYRAKVRDVVVTVNGKEYRWPPTAKQGDPTGERFTAQVDFVACEESSCRWGNRTHLTRAGAEAQNAMLNAALGGDK